MALLIFSGADQGKKVVIAGTMKRSQNIETFFIVNKKKRSAAGDSEAKTSSSGQHSAGK